MDAVMALAALLVVFAMLGIAAVTVGADSRDGMRDDHVRTV